MNPGLNLESNGSANEERLDVPADAIDRIALSYKDGNWHLHVDEHTAPLLRTITGLLSELKDARTENDSLSQKLAAIYQNLGTHAQLRGLLLQLDQQKWPFCHARRLVQRVGEILDGPGKRTAAGTDGGELDPAAEELDRTQLAYEHGEWHLIRAGQATPVRQAMTELLFELRETERTKNSLSRKLAGVEQNLGKTTQLRGLFFRLRRQRWPFCSTKRVARRIGEILDGQGTRTRTSWLWPFGHMKRRRSS